MVKSSKILFSVLLFLGYFLFPPSVRLFDSPQSSILIIYFVYLYLSYKSYANINTMFIARYETKGDMCFDFILRQGLFCLIYLTSITLAGFFFLFIKQQHSTTFQDIFLFFIFHFINLIFIGTLLLLLRMLYGTILAFAAAGLYISLSSFSYMFLGVFSHYHLANPFVLLLSFGQPLDSGAIIGYIFLVGCVILLAILLKRKDLNTKEKI